MMKSPMYATLFLSLIVFSCKTDTKTTNSNLEPVKELSIAERIAKAHGYDNWSKVNAIKFTFAVDRDTIKGNGRSWEWYPKKDSVVLKTPEKEFKYNRSTMDSTFLSADRAFINDKFWLLIPFQLVWDKTASISDSIVAEAPISKLNFKKITITYPNEGGYTPGDAYDIYYDKSYLIKEWTYRRGNSEEPSLSTTFESYEDFNGIKIARDHKQEGGNWNLNFSNISVTLK